MSVGRRTCGAGISSIRTTPCADFISATSRRTFRTSCTRNWASRETGACISRSALPLIDQDCAGKQLGCRPLLGCPIIRQEIRVENFPRDRRGRGGAESAVLDQNGDGDLGVVDRRKRNEPRMIAVSFRNVLGVILLVLLDGNHLRGSGL